MTNDPASNPDHPVATSLEHAAARLANLGFDLITADRGRGERVGHLFVAIRPAPTLNHYDPESIDYWISQGGRGRPARLVIDSRLPVESDYAWGRIALTDRLGVTNEFLSFGGSMQAGAAADGTVFVDFASDAPLLRWSGHSQGSDPVAAEIGTFFARLMVPIDFSPGAESLIAATPPRTLYCAFLQAVGERLARAQRLRDANSWLVDWVAHEAGFIEEANDPNWLAAREFRARLAAFEAQAPA
jgi:hypothetical protein